MRIVSLAPAVTEVIFALGLGESLAGVTESCDWPPEARRIERVGGFGKPNVEQVIALRPSLLVAVGLESQGEIEAFRAAGARILEVRINSFDDLFAAIAAIGKEAGRSAQADGLVASMRAELAATARRYADIAVDRRPRVFIEIWDDPLTTAGGDSFQNELISRAGGINVAGELSLSYPQVNPEQVIAWDPDAIIAAYPNPSRQAASRVASRIGWSGIRAVRNQRIIDDVPPDLLLRPGPRLIDGVKALTDRLYVASGTTLSAPNTAGGIRP